MSLKRRLYWVIFIILALAGELFFLGYMAIRAAEAADEGSKREIFVPASLPETDRLSLVSILPVTVETQSVGHIALYDDSTTERPADYLELYDRIGRLLAVSWFDRFGIERVALDRGLLHETYEPEGVFVLVLEGDSI
ncbi:MAG TPA: hypothetical protein VFU31_08830 [Candidatus Binatia bacterium]|nr:hypothetical protein [Candidatus Binatia bacterium]